MLVVPAGSQKRELACSDFSNPIPNSRFFLKIYAVFFGKRGSVAQGEIFVNDCRAGYNKEGIHAFFLIWR